MLICAIAMALIGCNRQSDVVTPANYPPRAQGVLVTNRPPVCSWGKLPSDAVLVEAAGSCYTKQMLEEEMRLAKRAVYKRAPSRKEADQHLKESVNTFVMDKISRFIFLRLYSAEAHALGLRPTADDLSKACLTVSNEAAQAALPYDAYVLRRYGAGEGLQREIRTIAESQALFRTVFSNSLEVTAAEVDKLYAELQEKRAASVASNKVIAARLTAFRAKAIREGFSCPDCAEDEVMLPGGFHCESFTNAPADSFEGEESVAVELSKLKVGEWSGPIASEDFLSVYQLTAYQASNFQSPALYSGYKVSLERDLGYELPEKEQLFRDIRVFKNRDIVGAKSDELIAKYGYAYPNGEVWRKLSFSMIKER